MRSKKIRYYAYNRHDMKDWVGSWSPDLGSGQLLYIERHPDDSAVLVYRVGQELLSKGVFTRLLVWDKWEELPSKPSYHDEFSHWVYCIQQKKGGKSGKKSL